VRDVDSDILLPAVYS